MVILWSGLPLEQIGCILIRMLAKTCRATFLLVLLCLLPAVRTQEARAVAPAVLRVIILDVGQGDATLIRDGLGTDVLIDGGRKSAGESVLAALRQLGVDNLEAVLATHADADHVGGLIDVLQAGDIPVESALYNGYPGDTQTWDQFVAAVAAEGLSLTPAQYPASYAWGAFSASVLNPSPGLSDPEQNAASVVLRLVSADTEWILPGDIDSAVEADLIQRGDPLEADLLHVAHHGSATATSQAFLAAVRPREAFISVGPNSYGHPAPDVLQRLEASGARTWRTDALGTIVVLGDGQIYQVFPQDTFLPLNLGAFAAP
jgi:competence protein ComEC